MRMTPPPELQNYTRRLDFVPEEQRLNSKVVPRPRLPFIRELTSYRGNQRAFGVRDTQLRRTAHVE